jgi:CheY-like chemotaxis protein
VLLVEDDEAVRMVVLEALEDLGYRTLAAESATQALPYLEGGERVDLLITDVGLPGLNGRQLAEMARQRRPGLRVLFATGYAERAAVRSGLLEEGMDILTKPFAMDALAERLHSLLRATSTARAPHPR